MTWPRRPEHGHVAHGGASLLVVIAMLLGLCGPATAQSPDPAPPASGPAPDPAPQAAPPLPPRTEAASPPAPAPPTAAPPPAPRSSAPAPRSSAPAAPAARTADRPAAQRERAKHREAAARRQDAKRRRAAERRARLLARIVATPALQAPLPVPDLVTEPGPLASGEARLAALALLVAAAGSLGLIVHLRRGTLE